MSGVNQKIGIFGGTFDPIHTGHLEIVTRVSQELSLDKTYVVPARNPWMKSDKKITLFKHRVKMLEIVFGSNKDVEIMCDEKEGEVSYTHNTLVKIEKKHPGADLYLVIGEDVISRIEEWKKIKEVLKRVTVVCVKREGLENRDVAAHLNGIHLGSRVVILEKTSIDASSSDYKKNNKTSFINKDVLKYIYKNNIYKHG